MYLDWKFSYGSQVLFYIQNYTSSFELQDLWDVEIQTGIPMLFSVLF